MQRTFIQIDNDLPSAFYLDSCYTNEILYVKIIGAKILNCFRVSVNLLSNVHYSQAMIEGNIISYFTYTVCYGEKNESSFELFFKQKKRNKSHMIFFVCYGSNANCFKCQSRSSHILLCPNLEIWRMSKGVVKGKMN